MSERTTEASQLTSRPSPTTVALAIPAYNEADGIGEFLHELDRCLGAAGFDATFVVVNDRSTDETAAVLTTVGPALAGQLLAVTAESNRGHGPTAHDAYTRCLDGMASPVRRSPWCLLAPRGRTPSAWLRGPSARGVAGGRSRGGRTP